MKYTRISTWAEGEEPVLGVRKTGMLTNDWTCFDNFRRLLLRGWRCQQAG